MISSVEGLIRHSLASLKTSIPMHRSTSLSLTEVIICPSRCWNNMHGYCDRYAHGSISVDRVICHSDVGHRQILES